MVLGKEVLVEDWDSFLQWEQASRDTIDVKRVYIDAAGDLTSGLLLSQIVYWYLPAQGKSKLRVNRDDRLWLVKRREDWWDECRLSVKQVDRSLKILRDAGYIETKLFKYKGAATMHISINLNALVEGVKRVLPKGENGICPKGKTGITETVNPLHTETTNIDYVTETTVTSLPKGKATDKTVPGMFETMHRYLGYPERTDKDPIPNYGVEGKAIKRMLARGYSPAEILSFWRKRVDFRGEYISMVYINQDIGKKGHRDKPTPGAGKHYQLPAESDLEKQAREAGIL
jgi:hypothetical protein